MKRTILIVLGIVILAVAGFFAFQRYQRARAGAASSFQTVQVTRGDLTASVGATGTARSNQSTVMNWQLSGRVAEVRANTGDQVKAGQVLATLDEKSLPQSVILARADLVTAKRNLDQLLNSNVAQGKAYQTLVAAQKELDDAKKARDSKNYDRALPETVDEARANVTIAEDAMNRANDLYGRMQGRSQDDPVRAEALAQLAKARRNYDTKLANLNWLLGRPDNQEVSQADARVMVAEASLKDAQREWDRIKSGPDAQDIEAAQARIDAIESTLAQIEMDAPFAGTITDANIKPGDQVGPSSGLAFRLDDLSRLLVDVQVTEVDINRIRAGQPVSMTFDAITDKNYSGKVVEVSRVGTATQGVVNFTVTVQIDNADGAVRPGMTAAVNIITDLVENTPLVPNRAVRLRNGKHVVYVLRGGVPVMTEIQLGLTSDVDSQLLGDSVKEGDAIVLNPPLQMFPSGGQPPAGMGARGGG